jgi:hypothetical protein
MLTSFCGISRSKSCDSQITAFRNIIKLTTRYPGLRRLFLRSNVFRQTAQSQDAISKLWTRSGDNVPPGWDFYLQFAAFCVANNEVTTSIEENRPSQLGYIYALGLSSVEKLVLFFE